MQQSETNKGNALLAEFDGMRFIPKGKVPLFRPYECDVWKAPNNGPAFSIELLKYHSDISWLWPCWVKFREIDFHDFSKNYEYTTYHKRIVGAFAIGDIPDIFAALVAGVEWYNSIKSVSESKK